MKISKIHTTIGKCYLLHINQHAFLLQQSSQIRKINDITIDNLKLRPIRDQIGTCYYQTGKVIAEYSKPLTKNELVITNTQQFPSMLNNLPFSEGEEDVSYDVDLLFTSIPVKETIDFIGNEIYNRKKLKTICKQSIFKKLLYKLTT